jgi:hypothetical protein
LCRFLFGFYAAFILLGGYAAFFYSSWRLCRLLLFFWATMPPSSLGGYAAFF